MTDIPSTIRKLSDKAPENRTNDDCAAVGTWLLEHPQELWKVITIALGLPDDDSTPPPVARRKRHCPRLLKHPSRSKSAALARFIESLEMPLSVAPDGELPEEARMRIIKDAINRCHLRDRAGLRFKTEHGYANTWGLRCLLEEMLQDARFDAKLARYGW